MRGGEFFMLRTNQDKLIIAKRHVDYGETLYSLRDATLSTGSTILSTNKWGYLRDSNKILDTCSNTTEYELSWFLFFLVVIE